MSAEARDGLDYDYEVAIIGGGLAGASAALRLAAAGFRCVLFEREAGPHHKVCGEFFSPECRSLLAEVGVDLQAEGAFSIETVCVSVRDNSTLAALPQRAWSLSRFTLDQLLLEHARKMPQLQLLQPAAVKDFKRDIGGGWRIEYSESSDQTKRELKAKTVVIATGKFEVRAAGVLIPRLSRNTDESRRLSGFKFYLKMGRTSLDRLNHGVELFVYPGGYGGLCRVGGWSAGQDSNAIVNFSFLVERNALPLLGRQWEQMREWLQRSNSRLRDFLADCEPVFQKPVSVATVPYGFLRDQALDENLFCIGDQLAVIPSLTGDGMAIALMSAKEVCQSLVQNESAFQFHKRMSSRLRKQIGFAYRFHQLFSNPHAVEWLSPLVLKSPSLLKWSFAKTRVSEPN